jgi:cytochrome c556
MMLYQSNGTLMSATKTALITFFALCLLSFSSHAELQDQGLNSILQIMDKAIEDIVKKDKEDPDYDAAVVENALAALSTLSRTLGTLSYSRLQCGQAEVLAEFTQRVQKIPGENQNPVRDAFQEGFDKSKEETVLLSDDECKRLTASRTREDTIDKTQVDGEDEAAPIEEVVEEVDEDEPRRRQLRIAELSGQLAYKTKVCNGKAVFTRDYNAFMETVPEEYQQEVKDSYWVGYQHGKRLNPNLTADGC